MTVTIMRGAHQLPPNAKRGVCIRPKNAITAAGPGAIPPSCILCTWVARTSTITGQYLYLELKARHAACGTHAQVEVLEDRA